MHADRYLIENRPVNRRSALDSREVRGRALEDCRLEGLQTNLLRTRSLGKTTHTFSMIELRIYLIVTNLRRNSGDVDHEDRVRCRSRNLIDRGIILAYGFREREGRSVNVCGMHT